MVRMAGECSHLKGSSGCVVKYLKDLVTKVTLMLAFAWYYLLASNSAHSQRSIRSINNGGLFSGF